MMVYVTTMSQTTKANGRVQVHRQGKVYAIVAQPGWTEADWDAAVPQEIQTLAPGDWNFQIIEDCEVWTINLRELERP